MEPSNLRITSDQDHHMSDESYGTVDEKSAQYTAGTTVVELTPETLYQIEQLIDEEKNRLYQRAEIRSEYLDCLEIMHAKEKQSLEEGVQAVQRREAEERRIANQAGSAARQDQDEHQHQGMGPSSNNLKFEKGQAIGEENGNDASPDAMSTNDEHEANERMGSEPAPSVVTACIICASSKQLFEMLDQLCAMGMKNKAEEICSEAMAAAQRALQGNTKNNTFSYPFYPTSTDNNKPARELELERQLYATHTEIKNLRETVACLAPIDRSAAAAAAAVRAAPITPSIATRSASYQATVGGPRYGFPHPATYSNWREPAGSFAAQFGTTTQPFTYANQNVPNQNNLAYQNYTNQNHLKPNFATTKLPPIPATPAGPAAAAVSAAAAPDGNKVFCTYWIRRGECDYSAVGCKYKHEMPSDPQVLLALGFKAVPKWYLIRQQRLLQQKLQQKQREKTKSEQRRSSH